jgi:hypothetical protein
MNAIDVDVVHEVDDCSPATIATIANRLERSTELEQFAYREAELDELWRVIDTARAVARDAGDATQVRWLDSLRTLTHEAHDLVGAECLPVAAAERLRLAIRTS